MVNGLDLTSTDSKNWRIALANFLHDIELCYKQIIKCNLSIEY